MISNPDKGLGDGVKCRAAISMAARSEELFQGLTSIDFRKACHVIEKVLPLEESYKGKLVSNMKSSEFREVIERDFVELIAKSWRITAEGDRPDYFIGRIGDFFNNKNDCLVVYAVKIHAPREYNDFGGLTQEMLMAAMGNYSKTEILGSLLKNDQSVAEYITFSGKGGALFVNGTISLKQDGNDAIYGIAVGFNKMAGISDALKSIFGTKTTDINEESSFILIAPYNTIANLCDVNNE
jgi:hypothetical protein